MDRNECIDEESYSNCHFAVVCKRCISQFTFCLTLKLLCLRGLNKYNDSMFLTRDSAVYTRPCTCTPVGSNASLSKVKPCDLCIVRAHAS